MKDELDNSQSSNTTESPTPEATIKDPAKLLATLEELRKENKQLYRDLKTQTVNSEELEQLRSLRSQVEEDKAAREAAEKKITEERLKKEQQYEALLMQRQSEFDKQLMLLQEELKAIKGENGTLKQQFEQRGKEIKLRDAKAAALDAFYATGGKRGTAENGGAEVMFNMLWNNGLNNRLSIQDDGGVEVLDEKGELRFNSQGKPMSLGEVMAEYRSGAMGILFDPVNNASGSGTPPQNPGRQTVNGKQVIKLPRSRMNDLISVKREYGIEDPLKAVQTGEIVFE